MPSLIFFFPFPSLYSVCIICLLYLPPTLFFYTTSFLRRRGRQDIHLQFGFWVVVMCTFHFTIFIAFAFSFPVFVCFFICVTLLHCWFDDDVLTCRLIFIFVLHFALHCVYFCFCILEDVILLPCRTSLHWLLYSQSFYLYFCVPFIIIPIVYYSPHYSPLSPLHNILITYSSALLFWWFLFLCAFGKWWKAAFWNVLFLRAFCLHDLLYLSSSHWLLPTASEGLILFYFYFCFAFYLYFVLILPLNSACIVPFVCIFFLYYIYYYILMLVFIYLHLKYFLLLYYCYSILCFGNVVVFVILFYFVFLFVVGFCWFVRCICKSINDGNQSWSSFSVCYLHTFTLLLALYCTFSHLCHFCHSALHLLHLHLYTHTRILLIVFYIYLFMYIIVLLMKISCCEKAPLAPTLPMLADFWAFICTR